MIRALLTLLMLAGSAMAAEVLVAAASDLAPMAPALSAGFANARGHRVKFTFGSSGSLARQIENGAPFDAFLSASESYVRELAAAGNVKPASIAVYALGRIALWSADGSVRELDDLRKASVRHIAIANPQHAPYGAAAKQALERRGLWPDVQSRLVLGENVRQALQFAESRNADAVITAWTLLKGRGTLLPAEWHDPIRQTGAVVQTSQQADAASAFLQYLASDAGQAVLIEGGLFSSKPAAKPAPASSAPARKRPAAARRSSRR